MSTPSATPATPVYWVGGPGIAWRETGGEIVVLDIDGSVYFGLNGSAAGLWKRLATDGASRVGLTAQLVAGTTVAVDRAETDVDSFLAELERFGLLHER